MSLRIVHADRHKLFHDGLKSVFKNAPDFEIVDHCAYLDLAIASLDRNKPDVLFTATSLYDTRNAVIAFCDYRDAYIPEMKIIVLTMVSSLDYFLNGLIKGVDGYLTKEASADDIY